MCAANCACSKSAQLVVMPRQATLGDGFQLPPQLLPSQIKGLTQDQLTPLLPTFLKSLPGGSKDNPIEIAPPPNPVSDFLHSLFAAKAQSQTPTSTSQPPASWWQSSDLVVGYTNGQIVEYALLGIGAFGVIVAVLRRRGRK